MQARVPSASLESLLETQNLCSDSLRQNLIVDRIAGDWNRISDPRGICTGQWFLVLHLTPEGFRTSYCLALPPDIWAQLQRGRPMATFFKIFQLILMLILMKLTGENVRQKGKIRRKRYRGCPVGATNRSQVDLNMKPAICPQP